MTNETLRTCKMVWADDIYGQSNNPCVVCGKALKGKNNWSVHVINGGSDVLHPEDEALYEDDGGDLGVHLVGSDCRKRFGEFAHKP